MVEKTYQFDVAFSFLQEDENLAIRLNNLLQERVNTFIYSNRQEVIAGTDGEKTFNQVFGGNSRIVVILYRDGWGNTAWTRIEETAIRNRAYDEGYDFVIFIPTIKESVLPKWLPKNKIWVGLDRWGEEGAASVIESRVQEFGGTPKEETAIDRANRLEQELLREADRKNFLGSPKGVEAAGHEIGNLFQELETVIDIMNSSNPTLNIFKDREERKFLVGIHNQSITFTWALRYSNSLDDSSLYIDLWKNRNSIRSQIFSHDAQKVNSWEYTFNRTHVETLGWTGVKSPKQFLTTKQLADKYLKILIGEVEKARLKDQ